ncbi:MAG TPA: hypothetical protein PLN21_13360 [Gemmatales bacterium]|nr:hypothetical protein [Gemmatales bacterium]
MSNMRKHYCLVVLFIVTSWAHAQPVTVFLVDDFNNGNGSTVTPKPFDGLGYWSGFGPGIVNSIGGNRVLGNYLTEITPGDPGPFTSSTNVASGVFSIDNPFNTRSSGEVIWQGNNVTPGSNTIISHPGSFANPMNLNMGTLLTASTFRFEWSVINADSRNWTYTIRAYTNSSANYFEANLTSSLSGVMLAINNNGFVVGAGAPTWNDIDAISFSASYSGGLLGGDLAIDFFRIAVPEMSTWMMIGLSLVLGGAFYARRYGSKAEAKSATSTEGEETVTTPAPEVPVLA